MLSNPPIGRDTLGLATVSVVQGPPVLLVSWIDRATFDYGAAFWSIFREGYRRHGGNSDVLQKLSLPSLTALLWASANPTPPTSFATRTAFFQWDAMKEHRGWTRMEPRITCCGNRVDKVEQFSGDDAGWTPERYPNPLYDVGSPIPALRSMTITRFGRAEQGLPDFDIERSESGCARITLLTSGRLALRDNILQGALLTRQPAPYISRQITYSLCCDAYVQWGDGGAMFDQLGTRFQSDDRLGQFMYSSEVVSPTNFANAILEGKVRSATQ